MAVDGFGGPEALVVGEVPDPVPGAGRLLARGASGSTGIAAVELAAAGGASVVAVTTASSERGDRLREHGATHVLDRAGSRKGLPARERP